MNKDHGTLADALFDAQLHVFNAEVDLIEHLEATLGDGAWADFTYDYYDRSIEIYGVKDQNLNKDQRKKFKELGFNIVWMHTVPKGTDSKTKSKSEKVYIL